MFGRIGLRRKIGRVKCLKKRDREREREGVVYVYVLVSERVRKDKKNDMRGTRRLRGE